MHAVIIGNGIAGITAARFIRKFSDFKITVISGETDHFFSRTALMYIYMGHMRYEDTKPYEDWFWKKNRIELKKAWVQKIDADNKQIHFEDGESMIFDKLIIATGSKTNKFGWPGQDLHRVQGMYSFQDLEGMEAASKNLKKAVIVGGGLIGIEMAEMFHSRHIPVTFLVREKSYWDRVLPPEESEMVNKHILENGIDLRLATELKSIHDDGNGGVGAITTSKDEKIECQFVGLTAGVSPNIDFLKNSKIKTEKGVLVNEFLQTNYPDIYSIGDCAQLKKPPFGRQPIEAIWYVGRIMGETVAHHICGNPKKYEPGLWFNSAKFFEIEYQVYGEVQAVLPPGLKSVYWQHADGKKSIRIVYDSKSQAVVGFNLMGVRYRAEICLKWIKEATPIEKVLQNLGMANFDPEFFDEYEKEVVAKYNADTDSNIQLKTRRGLTGALNFLKSRITI